MEGKDIKPKKKKSSILIVSTSEKKETKGNNVINRPVIKSLKDEELVKKMEQKYQYAEWIKLLGGEGEEYNLSEEPWFIGRFCSKKQDEKEDQKLYFYDVQWVNIKILESEETFFGKKCCIKSDKKLEWPDGMLFIGKLKVLPNDRKFGVESSGKLKPIKMYTEDGKESKFLCWKDLEEGSAEGKKYSLVNLIHAERIKVLLADVGNAKKEQEEKVKDILEILKGNVLPEEEIQKLRCKLKEQVQMLEALRRAQDELIKQKEENGDVLAELKKYNAELEELNKLRGECEAYKKQIEQVEKLKYYGFALPEKQKSEEDKESERPVMTMKDFVEQVKVNVKNQGFSYSDRVVERFAEALFTNQLLILFGATGTGKTSLPQAVSKAVGGKCEIISIQSNWSDSQDLLGFYNYVEKRYIPTKLLDALVEAGRHKERMYFVVLDEMNLAQVEYYFAKILSAMETESRTIELYGKHDYETERKKITFKIEQILEQIPDCEISHLEHMLPAEMKEEYWTLCEKWEHLNRYPAELRIPDNVQFVGTINMDASTKGISPKVVDRSFVIGIHKGEELPLETVNEQTDPDIIQPIDITMTDWYHTLRKKSETHENIVNMVMEYIDEIMKEVEDFVACKPTLSKRGEKKINEMISGFAENNDITNLAIDIIISKLFPTLRSAEVKREVNGFDSLEERIQKELKRMYDKENQEFNYWRQE